MATSRVGVNVRGLRQFQRAVKSFDKEAASALRKQMKGIADDVAADARSIASRVTTRRTGDLIRGIKPFARIGAAGVKSTAVHGGYEYPRRLEYEGRMGRAWGPRASLNPAIERKREAIEERALKALDEVLDDMSGGPS